MNTTQTAFLNMIVPLVQQYAQAYGHNECAVAAVIAQAIIESGWGKSTLASRYHNYFGMKCGSTWAGKSVNMTTKEEYQAGVLTTIKDNFRVYDSPEEGVKGYFEFVKAGRYSNLLSAMTTRVYLEFIRQDGYATSSTYVENCMNVVNTYDLEQYNQFNAQATNPTTGITASQYFPTSNYTGLSIVDALKSIGVDSSKTYRTKIATANGIAGYRGTVTQNSQLLKLFKQGLLLRP